MILSEASLNKQLLFFHGTKSKIDTLSQPSPNRPFFVCGDLDYAHSYAFAGQVGGRTNFSIKQTKPGFVYLINLDLKRVNAFNALDAADVSKLSRYYPKYVIDSINTKKWSLWSIFSFINKYLYQYYSKGFNNFNTFKKYLLNQKINDQLGNGLFLSGIRELIDRYDSQYKSIYGHGTKEWEALFNVITIFNNQVASLGFNAFINKETVSKVREADSRIVSNSAIGLFDKNCIASLIPTEISYDRVKQVLNVLDKKNISNSNVADMIQSFAEINKNKVIYNDKISNVSEAKTIDFAQYDIIEFEGDQLDSIIPHLRPLIKKSYEKIGGKQGERTVEQLRSVATLAQVVYDKGKILAFALMKKVHANDVGNKINLIGSDQTWKGKEAMQAILKHNIDNFKAHVWCECSGAIEHWFKKYDGYPIPNQYVPEIIGEPRGKVWFHEDGFHYRRFLSAAGGRFVQKMMFGFVNDDIMQKTLNSIGYEVMKDKINNKIHEDVTTSLDKAIQFVTALDSSVKSKEIDVMLPSIEEYLDKAIEILQTNNDKLAEIGLSIKRHLNR